MPSAAAALHRIAIEMIGDTGAAEDIGSMEALIAQGVPRGFAEALLEWLQNPVTFSTGGGLQEATEQLALYAKAIGKLQIHMLDSCPLALSIGKRVRKGATFI